MGVGFKLEVAAPSTQVKNSFTKTFTASSNAIQRLEISLKKEKGKISTLTAEIFDPGLKLLDVMPDIAFFDVPVALWLAKANAPTSVTTQVFSGIATAYQVGSYVNGRWTLVAHDNSFKARVNAFQRTFKNKNSVELVKALARHHGWTVDTSALSNTATLKQRLFSIGLPATGDTFYSDWDHLQRELLSDGLTAHMKGNSLIIHRAPQQQYAHTFRPGDGFFVDISGGINHVRGPGGLGNVSAPVAFDNADAAKALRGKPAQTAEAMKGGDGKTYRRPVGGPASTTTGAHTEDADGTKWTNQVSLARKRKDELTLLLNSTPDLFLTHLVSLDGVGSKFNGQWEPIEIRHSPLGDAEQTTVSLQRGVSKQAAKQAGTFAFAFSELK